MSMIEFVRSRKKGIVNFILLGLAIILMVSFGLESFMVKGNSEVAAIIIDGEEITQSEYQQKLRSMEQLYSSQLKGVFEQFKASLNLPQKIADQMIEERLLSRFLANLGLSASHSQVEERIAQLPYFGGKIDQKAYISYLQGTGMSESALIAATTKEIVEGEILKAFGQLTPVTEVELKSIYLRNEQQAKFIAAKFSADEIKENVALTDSDIQTYYDSHKQEFSVPKEIDLEFVLLSPKKYQDKVLVQDVDLKQLYQERSSQYVEPEKVMLSKISFQLDPEPMTNDAPPIASPNDKKRQSAQSVIDRVKKGEDFGQLAKELSEDLESRKKNGEIGWKKTTDLTQEVRDSLESVEAGQTTGIVEEGSQISVYLVNQRQKERALSFEEVREQLALELKAADAPMYLELQAEKFYGDLKSSNETLEDFSKREGVDFKVEKGISKNSFGVSRALKELALDSEKGDLFQVATEEGIYFAKVREIKPERVKTIEEAKAEILGKLQKEKILVIAKEKAQQLLQSANLEKTEVEFKTKATALGATIVQTELKPLADQKAPFISSPEDTSSLYALTSDRPIFGKVLEKDRGYFVVMLTEKKDPSPEDFAKKRGDILQQEEQRIGARLLDSLVQALRSDSKIEINPEILNQG
jgi:peptidyl-prolyl cis-trans isomerase D